jgi:hypothetical protein
MELIEGGGKYASVKDVEPAFFLVNPLAKADFHNDYGVEAIPDTEEARAPRACFVGRLLAGRPGGCCS